ncbi:MAG: flagellar motor protein MotD [Chromatiales bacterium]
MARRHKKNSENENHERWIVSYADFITLLFAFFVVMYSISSVNEGKYRVLSQTLIDAFQEPKRSLDPIQIGDLARGDGEAADQADNALIEMPTHDSAANPSDPAQNSMKEDSSEGSTDEQRLGYLAAVIENILADYIHQELVEVRHSDNRVMVDMKDKMLFPSASARLSITAEKVLREVSHILTDLPNQIQVEGNTDDRPIHTEEFPSNWELSAARAASVVHLMTRVGVDPSRMSAIGYGEYRPVADNDNEEGRQKNRRVTLVVLGLNKSSTQTIHLQGDNR